MSMKKISAIVTAIVFTVLTIAVVIILNFTKGDMRVDIIKSRTKIGLVTEGTINDASWSQSHYDALCAAAGDFGIEVIARENVSDEEGYTQAVSELIEKDDCFMVICTAIDCGDKMKNAAETYPDRFFIHIGGKETGRNICSFFGRMYQVRYLAGILAGTQTKTGNIGYVAPFPETGVNREINAFALGVRQTAPDAVVHVSFTGSWTDDSAADKSAGYLINDCGADIIAVHTETLSPLYSADKKGVLSIGCSFDNRDKLPGSFLSACLWDWAPFYREKIEACLKGVFRGDSKLYDIDSGIVYLADPSESGNAGRGYEGLLSDARGKLCDRSFDVFYGPVTDNEGNIRIADGESMSDEAMYSHFDWYVEGVKIEDRN